MSEKDESVREGVSTKYDQEPLGTRSQSLAATDYSDDFTPFIDATELSQWSFWRAGIAEFVAAFLFLYILVQTVAGTTHLAGSGVGPQGIAWAAGGTIFVLVYCTAGISGGHINPAITFGLFLGRKVSLPRTILYILCQCLGAICGAGIVKGFQRDLFANSEGGANAIGNGYSWGDALGAEIIGTFMLVYTVFCATDAKRSARDSHVPVLAPLPIGFTVLVVCIATLPITGTGINPARSLGSAVIVNTDKVWDDHWIFWVGPLLGAALAAMYHILVIRALPFSRTRKYR